MKKYMPLFTALLIAFGVHAQTGTCTLTGDIKRLGNHRVFISYSTDTSARSSHYDSLQAHHGHFVYQTHLDAPVFAYVSFHRNHKPLIKRQNGDLLTYRNHRFRNPASTAIMLENRDMHWHTRLDSVNYVHSHLDNAPMTDTLFYYYRLYTKLYKSDSAIKNWRVEWKKWKQANKHKTYEYAPDDLKAQRDSITHAVWKRSQDSIAAFIMAHPSSPLSAALIWQIYRYQYEKRQAIYAALDNSLKSSQSVVQFKKHLDLGPPADVRTGGMAPDIVLPDTSGRNIALSSLRGKYVLLHFWYPSREWSRTENHNLVKAYSQLHPKGLEIYSVALGDKKADWQKAIAHDKLSWIHVSELTWESKAEVLYEGEGWGYRSNFLIDPAGKIITNDIRGKNTATRLARLMK